MEYRDLYDETRNPLGRCILKGEKIPKGCYQLIVATMLENIDGTFLIQKRSKEKGGLWGVTSGHPISGESSIDGIVREVKEEVGLDIKNENMTLFRSIQTESAFIDHYFIKMKIEANDILLQKEEVEDYMFATKEKIIDLINKGLFHPKHVKMVLKYFDYKEGKKYEK